MINSILNILLQGDSKRLWIINLLLLWLYITYKAMGYQLFSLTMGHFDIKFSNLTTLDLSVQLATVFKMSKYMKTLKITSENYKKQIPFFQKFTEPKISYNIPWDISPHFVRPISCEAKLFPFDLRQTLDFGNFFSKWLDFFRIVSHPKT